MIDTILMIGAPCVGKSTVSSYLKSRYGYSQFSVRLFTRYLMESGHPLGVDLGLEKIVKMRKYLPDCYVERIFAEFLHQSPSNIPLIIEGYPINAQQTDGMFRQLSVVKRSIDTVLILSAGLEELQKRMQRRKVCPACELKNRAGLPFPPNAKTCPYCGKPLVRRLDDDPSFFQRRYEYFIEEKKLLCSQERLSNILELCIDGLSVDQVNQKVYDLLKLKVNGGIH